LRAPSGGVYPEENYNIAYYNTTLMDGQLTQKVRAAPKWKRFSIRVIPTTAAALLLRIDVDL
jgi:hypothetical protein